ncbi:MAG: gamma-glutamyltransferase, partial [Hyphomonas sp.]|nr:gamma-glutamyltransferase [Hyphomonas sp.]
MKPIHSLLAVLLLSGCAAPQDSSDVSAAKAAQDAARTAAAETAPAPEADAAPAWTKGAMVAAADPRAVEAGLEILREGGNAIDAAIAVHAVLGLVEPQSSGLGG